MGVGRPQKSHQSIRTCEKGCPRTGPHPKQSSYFIGLIVKTLQWSDQGFVTVRSFIIFCPVSTLTFSFQNFQGLYLTWNIMSWLEFFFHGQLTWSWWGPYYEACTNPCQKKIGLWSFKFNLWQHLLEMIQPQFSFTISSSVAWFRLKF
jgi:hypothetical protein